MNRKEKTISILEHLSSRRLTPYLALIAIIGTLLLVRFNSDHDGLRGSLVIELLGALILLISFDLLQSWRIERNQKHEANYKLYLAYQLIYPHARKYMEFVNEITSDNFLDQPKRDLSKINFIDLRYFFNPSYYSDTPNKLLVYHLYFESLFKTMDEVHKAIFFLNPAFHFEIIELYREFTQENEKAYRLYTYFKSIENDPDEVKRFEQEIQKILTGKQDMDAKTLVSKPSPLNPFAKLYLLTLYNVKTLAKQADLVQDKLKEFHDVKAGNLLFYFE